MGIKLSTEHSQDVEEALKPPVLSLMDFAITKEDVGAMREQMLNDVFVLDGLALLGQTTIIFAAPNSGKTLITVKLIRDAVENGHVKGEDVFYVNVDDTYKGGIEKADLLQAYGINVILPNQKGFKAASLVAYLESMAIHGTAKGKVIILDTMKKFTNLMDKSVSSAFNEVMRQFTAAGGTVIALAHVNKNKDADGKSIYGGTSDSRDDADCCFLLDVIKETEKVENIEIFGVPDTVMVTEKIVEFTNDKSRGDVVSKVAYTYKKQQGGSYADILNSVDKVDAQIVDAGKRDEVISKLESQYHDDMVTIFDYLNHNGETAKTELVKHIRDERGTSKAKVIKVLDLFTGKRWKVTAGDKGAKLYSIIGLQSPSANLEADEMFN